MHRSIIAVLLLVIVGSGRASGQQIKWLVEYDGKSEPVSPTWTSCGVPIVKTEADGLHLRDDSRKDVGYYQANWPANPSMEIVVEATVKFGQLTGAISKPGSKSFWPWRDGAPVAVWVSDGQHQEALVFYSKGIGNCTDRFVLMDTANEFHTYQMVIRGTDMSVAVDGQVKIKGQNAFWKRAPEGQPFLRFGSNSKYATGDAVWKSVRLGVRKPTSAPPDPLVKVTASQPWEITRPELKYRPTRPYLYDVGRGVLMMSVAEGPDAFHEPYGVMISQDEGKTWTPAKGMEETPDASLPMIRLNDGRVVGPSRWTWVQPDLSLVGRTAIWEPDLRKFDMFESRMALPPEFSAKSMPFTCERHIFLEEDGSLRMAGYTKTGPSTPEGNRSRRRYSHLVRSTDLGKTWTHDAVIGAGGEPAVVKLGCGKMTAILRTGPFMPFVQTFSEDNGKTWTNEREIEEGSVCPDLVLMSNGLLACSYGRPTSCLMFSADGGKTWTAHQVITEKMGFNYSGIIEVRPGRLLYLHDAGGLQGLYVDVQRLDR